MPEELAIRIEELSISYKVSLEAKRTLKNAVMRASLRQEARVRRDRWSAGGNRDISGVAIGSRGDEIGYLTHRVGLIITGNQNALMGLRGCSDIDVITNRNLPFVIGMKRDESA